MDQERAVAPGAEAHALYERAAGVWMDAFESDWFSREVIEKHLAAGKMVAVISPEIHGRDPAAVWKTLRGLADGKAAAAATAATPSVMRRVKGDIGYPPAIGGQASCGPGAELV